MIAEARYAPSTGALATRAGLSTVEVEAGLRRLHDAHALQLHPHGCRPWVVHPFALAPGSCWVQTPRLGYWGELPVSRLRDRRRAANRRHHLDADRRRRRGRPVRRRGRTRAGDQRRLPPVDAGGALVGQRRLCLLVVPAVPRRGRRGRLVRAACAAKRRGADDAGAVGVRQRLVRASTSSSRGASARSTRRGRCSRATASPAIFWRV